MPTVPFTVDGDTFALVPVGPEHAQAIHALLQDPDFSQTTSIPWPYTMPMAEEWTNGAAQRWKAGNYEWVVVEHSTGEVVGTISLFASTRIPNCYEIGYCTAKKRWGQGVTTEAVSMVIDCAFERLGATRIEWFANVGNWGSWKAVWRCGFRREGIQRRADAYYWQAAILAEDPREPASPWDGPNPTPSHAAALDPSRPSDLVAQFHAVYSMPNRVAECKSPTLEIDRIHMRLSLISEEFAELIGAVYGLSARRVIEEALQAARETDEKTRDVVEAADALADMVYVIYGMALECGINLDAVLAEVQASNLSKLMPDGSVKLREDGKVLKGPNFFAPDVRRALGLTADGVSQ